MMISDRTIGTVSRPWVSMLLGCGGVALFVQGMVSGEAVKNSVVAALMAGTVVSFAVWAYSTGRAVVLIQSDNGVLIKARGVVSGPITSIVLTERFNVSPWHYLVSATCMDGSVVSGVLFPPVSMVYSREQFKRRLQSFLHPLVSIEGQEGQG
jgi:hypothetical protein